MIKIKKALLFLIALCNTVIVFAQSIDDGKRFLYYERHLSAKNVFEKLLASNANNTDAAYWLGQAFIGLEDIASAKAIYQKTLQNNSNSALLIAGMGHIELLEGKVPDARNRFETALSLSQNKNIDVLNAIGYANASPETKNGDALYAIEKLQIATGLKGMKDPEVYCNLGDAYKKLADGGNAQKSYEKALALDPKYARAFYRIGKVYQTQGTAQEELYMKYYNDAIAADVTYGPVYKNLHEIFYSTDVTKSADYLDKYLANIDDEPKNCYFKASMKYAQGLFADALTACDACINGNPAPYPNLYGLKGYAYA
ncbi:MAG: tetratricopeptide repeat protein, partial [Ferruginibacter sp.]